MMHNSKVAVNPDGQVVLTACGTEMKDVLSIVADSTKWRKQSSLVPYFDRKRIMKARADTNLSSPQFEVESIAPLKSPEKIKLKPSPKKGAGREISTRTISMHLLTQFSASIAGAGLAVLFTIIFEVACGRVPFGTSKLFSTGLAFGLVWLSRAVDRLRDTVVHISKNISKLDLVEEEMIKRVGRSLNQIYFRAATLMAVAVLRFV
ncbi:DNA-directed RNA polymerase III subunit RPC8-like [Hibiscus syriacus]|uniref:DNA-directed RNA polymerase III subunit RPC8-like n=1 Tax=Hibiscus syriacus TaxID=106335 RepID=A0A6A2XTX4_HIBSY|nr:DNA-directed RNA polymerase III subunit RPC8-like [Hibiscus syriacus]